MNPLVRRINPESPLLIVLDPPSFKNQAAGNPYSATGRKILERALPGVNLSACSVICCGMPIPDEIRKSDARVKEHLARTKDNFNELVGQCCPLLVLTLGKNAASVYMGRPVKINSFRGKVHKHEPPVLATFSPAQVALQPRHFRVFESDLALALKFRRLNYSFSALESALSSGSYSVERDISYLLEDPPRGVYADTETIGNRTFDPDFRVLCVQLCWEESFSIMIPTDQQWWNENWPQMLDQAIEELEQLRDDNLATATGIGEKGLTDKQTVRLDDMRRLRQQWSPMFEDEHETIIEQLRELFGSSIKTYGHNFKYDIRALKSLGIEVANFTADTMQLAANVDENMDSKSADDCVRRWVPEMAGYADQFNKATDKSRMDLVNPLDFLNYGCGDVDAGRRLLLALWEISKQDEQCHHLFNTVQMPTLRAFAKMEVEGIDVDIEELGNLGEALKQRENELYQQLLDLAPRPVTRRWLAREKNQREIEKGRKTPKEILNFNSADLVVEILFDDPNGFHLEPQKFTDSTAKLHAGPYLMSDDPRVPKTGKDHLAYFKTEDTDAGEFCALLDEYSAVKKMLSTYVGQDSKIERKKVHTLKSGKAWPKKVVDSYLEAGQDFPEIVDADLQPQPQAEPRRRVRIKRRRRPAQELNRVPLIKKPSFDYVETTRGLYLEERTEQSGFWKYLLSRDCPRLFPSFFLHRTVTLRTSSADPNFQNIPKHGSLAEQFRRVFVAPPGWKFIEVDLSQIELRIMAWMANEDTMLNIYREGGDIHAYTAAKANRIDPDYFKTLKGSDDPMTLQGNPDVTTANEFYKHTRFLAKGINFGFLYGMWWVKFKDYIRTDFGITLTDEEAQHFREVFFETYPELAVYHRDVDRYVREYGHIRALHGGLRRLVNVFSVDEGIQKEAVRQGINSPIQRFGSDIGLCALHRFVRDCPWDRIRPCAFIHDAMIIAARDDSVEEAAAAGKFYMESVPFEQWFGVNPPLPITADAQGPWDNLDMSQLDDWDIESAEPDWFNEEADRVYDLVR